MPFQDMSVGGTARPVRTPVLTFPGVPRVSSPPVSTQVGFGNKVKPISQRQTIFGDFGRGLGDLVFGTPVTTGGSANVPLTTQQVYQQNADTRREGGLLSQTVTQAKKDGQAYLNNLLKDKLNGVLSDIGAVPDDTPGVTQVGFERREGGGGVSPVMLALGGLAVAGAVYFATKG